MNAGFGRLDQMVMLNDRAHVLECTAVEPDTRDVRTFSFRVVDAGPLPYVPGQFITLELPAGPQPLLRSYTLSSSPSRPNTVSVTAKAAPDSVGTRWMFDHVDVGSRLRAYGPFGSFSSSNHPAERYLFISAGSGVTPMMSMTRWLLDTVANPDVAFMNCARTPSDLIFRTELEEIGAGRRGVKLAWIVSNPDVDPAWRGFRGRLTPSMLSLAAPDLLQREVFCCGPEAFMQAVRGMLVEAGLDMSHYHEESFGEPVASTPASESPVAAGSDCTVNFTESGVVAAGSRDDTILAIAEKAGVFIPSGCQLGLCGMCMVRCTGGETEISHNGGISDEEIEEGFVLACCTRTRGAVEIAM